MMASPKTPIAWGPVLGALVVGASIAGVFGWRLNLRSLDDQIRAKQKAVKKLTITGGVSPNEDVMAYLASRQASLEQRYQSWLQLVSAPPLAEAAQADPQLYFQERFHEVQRTLERLSTARGIAVPEQLGFPKELPPTDTVPRLLVQLSLIQELSELMLEQGVTVLSSLKVEDPEPVVDAGGEDADAFLTRLPVRVRLTGSLSSVMKTLASIHHAKPLIDVRSLHIAPASAEGQAAGPDALEAELLLARYLVLSSSAAAADAKLLPAAKEQGPAGTTGKKSPSTKARRQQKPEKTEEP